MATPLGAKPDFSRTAMTANPTPPREGDVVTFTVRVRNTGDQDSPGTQIDLDLSREGMFIDFAGLAGATLDRNARRISGTVTLVAGGEHRITFRVLAPRDSGGNVLSPRIRVSNLFLAADHYGHAHVVIETRPGVGGVTIGGLRIAPAGLAVLAVLALYPLLRFALRSRRVSRAAVAAVVVALGFWTLFVVMAWRDWRSVREWRETRCEILDSRLRVDTTSSDPRGTARRTTSSATTTYEPLLALAYDADGHRMISSGFDTGSRVSIGGFGGAVEEFARWPVGTAVPCWFDPAHPEDVAVIRGFGGAYLFALFPLPLFLFGMWAIRTHWSSPFDRR